MTELFTPTPLGEQVTLVMSRAEYDSLKHKDVLLRASYDMLKRLDHGEDFFGITAAYDGVDCDGSCLLTDIAHELQLPDLEDTEPLPSISGE